MSYAVDAVVAVGLLVIGIGIAQWSTPVAWVYGGAVVVAAGLLAAYVRESQP